MSTRPNILWICTDQQRFDTIQALGNQFALTPRLDRLVGEGTTFTNAFCQSPVCAPSRASFLTGRYPRTTRCRQNGQSIPGDEVLISKIFSDAGYRCGLAGKLQGRPLSHPRVLNKNTGVRNWEGQVGVAQQLNSEPEVHLKKATTPPRQRSRASRGACGDTL